MKITSNVSVARHMDMLLGTVRTNYEMCQVQGTTYDQRLPERHPAMCKLSR